MAQPTPPMFAESQRRCLVLAATFLAGSLIGYWINNRAPSAAGTAATAERKLSQLHASSSRLGDTSRVFPSADPTGDGSAHAASDITSAILSATHARDYFQRRHDIYAAGQKLDRTTIRAALDATTADVRHVFRHLPSCVLLPTGAPTSRKLAPRNIFP